MSSAKLAPLVVEVIPNELQVLVYTHDIHHAKSNLTLSYNRGHYFGHPVKQNDPFCRNVNIF